MKYKQQSLKWLFTIWVLSVLVLLMFFFAWEDFMGVFNRIWIVDNQENDFLKNSCIGNCLNALHSSFGYFNCKEEKIFWLCCSYQTEMKDGKGILGHLEAKFTDAGSWYNSTDINSHSFHLELQMLSTPEIPDMYADCSFYYNRVFSA